MKTWTLASWKNYIDVQPVNYADEAQLASILDSLTNAPSLVELDKIQMLAASLRQVAKGEAFILQAGECAERFVDAADSRVQAQAQLLQDLSQKLAAHLQKPVVTVGRIAGQYAKPRSLAFETQEALSLENYRGDLINAFEFSAKARAPDPQRLLMAYQAAQQSLKHLDRHSPEIYTSHEVLHLAFEQSLTRQHAGQYYNTSTHFPWVGLRTAQPESAHIEYLRGIANPIAIKLSSNLSAKDIKNLLLKLNPERELGRLSLIHRLGAHAIAKQLPLLIKAVQETEIPVLWICDPMHGNTQRNARAHKFRLTTAIADELQQAIQIHQDLDSSLAGLHLELTSDAIRECVDDASELGTSEPSYIVDPRLNREQAMALVGRIRL